MIRQPIITVLGHVDHGKTSVLDYIRGTTIAEKEAGRITQHIGATEVPLETIQQICGKLLHKFNLKFTIPGLLFIDTPGHEAFTNLRKRGGSVADLAIVVIDITQGVQPQTKEAIDILKTFKVPFVIAANKVDLIRSWRSHDKVFINNYEKQLPEIKEYFDKRLYSLIGQLSEVGFNSHLYNKVDDYRKTISIVPISAKTGEGMSELLALLTGLSQKFLEDNLRTEITGVAKGSVLEIKEVQGLGTTIDAIIYDGTLKVNDVLVLGGKHEIIKTKIKALLKPNPLTEIRAASHDKWKHLQEVSAATGVKIVAHDFDKAMAGSPLQSARTNSEEELAVNAITAELERSHIETQSTGAILKTDTLGSLEAIAEILKRKQLPILKAEIGDVNRKDVMEAIASNNRDEINTAILAFNVKIDIDAKETAEKDKIVIISKNVIYHLIDDYEELVKSKQQAKHMKTIESLNWPAKFKILPDHTFRISKPAIVGISMLVGKLKIGGKLMDAQGHEFGELKSIELDGEKVKELKAGLEAAIAISGTNVVVGRQIHEKEVLYSAMSETNFRALKAKKELLSADEIKLMQEIAEIKRKTHKTWGL